VTFYVHPRRHQLSTFGMSSRPDVDGDASVPKAGGVAFYSLRPYIQGDDSRLIHWPSSARAGDLMVRQNTVPDSPGYLVVLDVDARRYTDTAFEEAVRIAASLSVAAMSSGANLRLRTATLDLTAVSGSPLTPVLDLLAEVELQPITAAWTSLLARDDDVAGVAVVTGRMVGSEVAEVVTAAPPGSTVAVARVDPRAPATAPSASGMATVYTVRTSAEFADHWNGRRAA
jgi:uncharacterized protein (DUF58 family)